MELAGHIADPLRARWLALQASATWLSAEFGKHFLFLSGNDPASSDSSIFPEIGFHPLNH